MKKNSNILLTFFPAAILCAAMVYFVLILNATDEDSSSDTSSVSASSLTEDTQAAPTPAPLSDEEINDVYADVLTAYKDAYDEGYEKMEDDSYVNPNLGDSLSEPVDLSYAYVDTMDDGYPELLIADVTSDGYKVLDLLAYDGSEVSHLTDFPSDRINVKLLEDGVIYEANWEGEDNRSYSQLLQILPFSSEPANIAKYVILIPDKYEKDATKSYYYTEGDGDEEEITREKYISYTYAAEDSAIVDDIDWQSISDYK